jgi:hypothetical protein
MANATITTKGQVTILKEIRDYLNLDTGNERNWIFDLLTQLHGNKIRSSQNYSF